MITLIIIAALAMIVYAFQNEIYEFLCENVHKLLPYFYAITTLLVVTYLCYFIVYKPVLN